MFRVCENLNATARITREESVRPGLDSRRFDRARETRERSSAWENQSQDKDRSTDRVRRSRCFASLRFFPDSAELPTLKRLSPNCF